MFGIRRSAVGMAVTGALVGLSVFGAATVHAQTPAPPGPERRLSITDAVELALQQNADLEVVRLNPQLQDVSVSLARSAWAPTFTTFAQGSNRDTPINSLLAGDVDKLENNSTAMNFGLTSALPWHGASYQVGWENNRATTNNVFANFTPQTGSNLTSTSPSRCCATSASTARASSCRSRARTARSPTCRCARPSPRPPAR